MLLETFADPHHTGVAIVAGLTATAAFVEWLTALAVEREFEEPTDEND